MDQEPAAALGVEMWLRWTQMFTSLLAAFLGMCQLPSKPSPNTLFALGPGLGTGDPQRLKHRPWPWRAHFRKTNSVELLTL